MSAADSVRFRSCDQSYAQTMVDADTHTEVDGYAGDQRPVLQTCPRKHETNLGNENGSYDQAEEFVT